MLYPVKGIIDGVGILEDRLHLTPIVQLLLAVHRHNIDAFVENLAGGDFGKPQNQIRQRRFAATAFAGNGRNSGRSLLNSQVVILQRHRDAAVHKTAAINFSCVANF